MSPWIKRWEEEAGYRDFLRMAVPLIISTSAWTIQHFIDRVFLTWHSDEEVAASMAAGILYWVFGAFLCGTAGYVNTFVAQYYGANRPNRVGPAIWQGAYFSIITSLIAIPLFFLAPFFFKLFGHEETVMEHEIVYFQILCHLLIFNTTGATFSTFFTGRGDTMTVMWVNIAGTLVNIVFDWIMIFGNLGCPEMGIAGAGWATLFGGGITTLLFAGLMLRKTHREQYATLSGWRFDWELYKRLLRFGLPSGVQQGLDVFSWALFILLIGRIGTSELAITSIAFNINMLAFVPMFGCGITVSTLVGQYLGKDDPDLAAKATWSGTHITLAYMTFFAVIYLLIPNVFMEPFAMGSDPAEFEVLRPTGIVLLRFMSFYCLFDAMNIIFAGALRGAGDTRFVLFITVGLGWLLMVIPIFIFCTIFGAGLYTAWSFATLFMIVLSFCFLARFRGGKWREMRVIEPELQPHMPVLVDSTPTETP